MTSPFQTPTASPLRSLARGLVFWYLFSALVVRKRERWRGAGGKEREKARRRGGVC